MISDRIKYLVMDVDGTLTDGKIYCGNNGELFKAFNIKDGYAIAHILKKNCIEPIVITGRTSEIVTVRCKELGIKKVFQGKLDKMPVLIDVIGNYGLKSCAYIGDDEPDLGCMLPIKEAGGIVGCPKDAVKKVIELADFVADHNGGDGAVRDFIEWILES